MQGEPEVVELERQLRSELSAVVKEAPRFPGTVSAWAQVSPETAHRRSGLAMLLAAAAVVAVIGAAGLAASFLGQEQGGPSFSANGSLTPSDGTVTQAPTPLPGSAAALDEALDDLDDFSDRKGFAGMVVADSARSVTLYWTAEAPADVAALDGSTMHGILISVAVADFSSSQLQVAGESLKREAEGVGIHVSGYGPAPGGTGLEVVVNRSRSADSVDSKGEVLRLLTPLAEVPIVDVSFGGGVGTWPAPPDPS